MQEVSCNRKKKSSCKEQNMQKKEIERTGFEIKQNMTCVPSRIGRRVINLVTNWASRRLSNKNHTHAQLPVILSHAGPVSILNPRSYSLCNHGYVPLLSREDDRCLHVALLYDICCKCQLNLSQPEQPLLPALDVFSMGWVIKRPS